MENKKPGRPKSNKPIRNKSITIKLTESELNNLKEVCYEYRLSYVEVLLKGLEQWTNK